MEQCVDPADGARPGWQMASTMAVGVSPYRRPDVSLRLFLRTEYDYECVCISQTEGLTAAIASSTEYKHKTEVPRCPAVVLCCRPNASCGFPRHSWSSFTT